MEKGLAGSIAAAGLMRALTAPLYVPPAQASYKAREKPCGKKAKRRQKNKAARKARKINK